MDELDTATQKHFLLYGTNAGHGHVWRRPDGRRTRCGGPQLCNVCARDAAAVAAARYKAQTQGG